MKACKNCKHYEKPHCALTDDFESPNSYCDAHKPTDKAKESRLKAAGVNIKAAGM
jgi:hypothetical protein